MDMPISELTTNLNRQLSSQSPAKPSSSEQVTANRVGRPSMTPLIDTTGQPTPIRAEQIASLRNDIIESEMNMHAQASQRLGAYCTQ